MLLGVSTSRAGVKNVGRSKPDPPFYNTPHSCQTQLTTVNDELDDVQSLLSKVEEDIQR